jgi:hypothetical protein
MMQPVRRGISEMRKSYLAAAVVVITMCAGPRFARAQGGRGGQGGQGQSAAQQTAPPEDVQLLDGWGRPVVDPLKPSQKPGPAPKHDISGTWEPAQGPGAGIQANGPRDMPYDGKPEHDPPYSALGLQMLKQHKPLFGYAAVLESLNNDPRGKCDPLGFPRADFYQVRHTQIMQDQDKVVILYQFEKRWRVIWTDGRELPKEVPEPRWYGYAVGKWVDDNTLVVTTIGTMGDERAWLDETGRPQSDAMRVEETFHRVDHDHLELSVTVDDPKMYTRPWVAINKFPMKLQSREYDVTEMMCIPSEIEQYSKDYGDPASGVESSK